MTDPRREFRVESYLFSLGRIPRNGEEREAEVWADDLQNRIPISHGLGQRKNDWGIPFPIIIPHPYPPTLRAPTEPARYIPTRPTIQVNAGAHSGCDVCGPCNGPSNPKPSAPNQHVLSVPITLYFNCPQPFGLHFTDQLIPRRHQF